MRVLIVEDDEHLSFLWQETLEEHGFACTVVRSCNAALFKGLANRYDICIVDLYVEDGDTLELSAWLASRNATMPIMMLTGSNVMPNGEHAALAHGVSWLIRKPVKPTQLAVMATYLVETSPSDPKHAPRLAAIFDEEPALQAC